MESREKDALAQWEKNRLNEAANSKSGISEMSARQTAKALPDTSSVNTGQAGVWLHMDV
jgi:hypothetical protein